MTRNLKALGLALLAAFALSAIAAQGALAAENHEFTATDSPVDLTGSQEGLHEFTAGKPKTTCTEANFSGTVANPTSDKVRVTPTYGGHCTLGSLAVEVNNNKGGGEAEKHCEYVFDSDTTSNGEVEDAPVSVDCNHEGSITITNAASTCVVHISDTSGGNTVNQNLHGVTFDKEGSGAEEDLLVTATVTGIHFVATGGACILLGIPATGNNGTYTGDTTVRGYEDGNHAVQIGITLETDTDN